MNCYKCQTELVKFDQETNRWFEGNERPHHCERINLFTDSDQKGKLGFFVAVSETIIAKNITDAAVKNHWNPNRLLVMRVQDYLIVKPR